MPDDKHRYVLIGPAKNEAMGHLDACYRIIDRATTTGDVYDVYRFPAKQDEFTEKTKVVMTLLGNSSELLQHVAEAMFAEFKRRVAEAEDLKDAARHKSAEVERLKVAEFERRMAEAEAERLKEAARHPSNHADQSTENLRDLALKKNLEKLLVAHTNQIR